MNFVYILRCADNTLYTGWTTDLAVRVARHNSGRGAKCTRSRLPVEPVYFELYETAVEAQRREYALKQLTRLQKEAVIAGGAGYRCHREGARTVVTVPAGTHRVTAPIRISGAHIEVRGEPGAILSGSVPLTGEWEALEGGVYRIPTDRVADVLYVDGKKYRMARYPKYNPLIPVFGGFSAKATSREKAAEWQDPRGGYVHAMHSHNWGGFSYEIMGKDEEGELILEGGWQNNRQMGMHRDFRYVENVREEMTEPGEWFFDRVNGYVYVIPEEGADLSLAEITVNSAFFRLEGCEDVNLSGLTLTHGARTFMKTKEPLLRSDWTIYRGGAVYYNKCKDCTVTRCTFTDIGSNGVFVDGDNRSIRVEQTELCDIGASAVCFVGRSDSVRSPLFEAGETQSIRDVDKKPGPKSKNYPKDCAVEDCLICRVGLTEKQATGVEISMSSRITVRNCTVASTSRAAINVSEGTFGGHLIEGCDVFDTVRETGDHGSFNSWGRDRFWHARDLPEEEVCRYAFLDCVERSVIRANRFRCDRGWDIDLDDGSGNYEIAYNLCLNGGIKLREGFGRHVHHNITVNNTVHMHVWYPNSDDVVEHNVLFRPYAPILMREWWGRSFDCNVLHEEGRSTPAPAVALSSVSGMDEHSVVVGCHFADPETGDYRIADMADFASFPTEFGVRYAPLRAKAPTPVLPSFREEEKTESVILTLYDMKVKNIETDGEMSAYGTAGYNGAMVVDADHFGRAIQRGLLPGDVIVAVGDREIHTARDIEGLERAMEEETVILLRAQGRTVLPPR